MSFHPHIRQVTPQELQLVQAYPESFESLTDNDPWFEYQLEAPTDSMLSVDEFTLSLLTDLSDDGTPLHRALLLGTHTLEHLTWGFGSVTFHTAEEVAVLAQEVATFPAAALRARFTRQAEQLRLAAADYLASDDAMIAYQQQHFQRLVQFYQEAAQRGNAMLLMLM